MRNTAAAVLVSTAAASKIAFRPYTDGRTPWYATTAREDPYPWPHDYFVPDFGVDRDIKLTKMNLEKAEKEVGHSMHASFAPAPSHPVDYPVPDFGVDHDIKATAGSLKSAENELGHNMYASFAQPAGHPVDYFVPNFGVDHDIGATQGHIAAAEKKLGHVFSPPVAEAPAPDNRIPDLGLDADVKTTAKNLDQAETAVGHSWELVQLNSDPICSSAGCTQYLHPAEAVHPMDYFVPNFGRDQVAVLDAEQSLAAAEKQHGHKWEAA